MFKTKLNSDNLREVTPYEGSHSRKKTNNNTNRMSRKKTKKKSLHLIRKFFIFIFSIILLIGFLGLGMIKGILDSTPSISSFHFGPTASATRIYDKNGNITNTLVQEGSNRENITFEELNQNPYIINAFVAIEDARFWEHSGIDTKSIVRAIYGIFASDSSRGGGSTITQQLVKNAVFTESVDQFGNSYNVYNEKGFEKYVRKLQEQYIALMYETQDNMSKKEIKEQIITDYLNIINLGSNTLGVKVAARRYFDKEVKDLTLSESAVIASITKNPSKYNPINHPEENKKRRAQVLSNMLEYGLITNEEYEEAKNDDVYSRIKNVDIKIEKNTEVTSYFNDAVISQVRNDLIQKLGVSKELANNMLYSGGLKIYTTQDINLQNIVDKHIKNEGNYTVRKYSIDYRLSVQHSDETKTHYSQIDIEKFEKNIMKYKNYTGLFNTTAEADKFIAAFKEYTVKDTDEIIGESVNYILEPQCSFVLIDHHTGEVLAINGGRGEKTLSRTLNRAVDSKRQPGSTFKVLTAFAPALQLFNKTLASVYYDSEYSYKTKQFKNWYNQGFLGFQNIRSGIIYSLNIIAIRCLMETVTPEVGVEFAKKFGISTLSKNDYNPASALGGITDGVSNLELTAAFSAIANEGVLNAPRLYSKILDNKGNVLIDNTKSKTTVVLSKENAFLLTDAMKQSMEGRRSYSGTFTVGSTSTRARFSGMSLAGKSGTTTSNNDIWFIGYSPYYTAGVWGGCDENQTLEDSRKKINNGGTYFHKDIWKYIMQEIHKDKTDIGFNKPQSIITRQVCKKSGLIATDACKNDLRGDASYTEFFADGTQPLKRCDFHNANGTVNIPAKYGDLVTDDTNYQDFNSLVIPNIDVIPNIEMH